MSLPTDIQLHLAPYILFCALPICTRILHRMLDNILCMLFQECNLWLFVLSLYSFASLLYTYFHVYYQVLLLEFFFIAMFGCVCGLVGKVERERFKVASKRRSFLIYEATLIPIVGWLILSPTGSDQGSTPAKSRF